MREHGMKQQGHFAENFDGTQTISGKFSRSPLMLYSQNHVSNGPKINDVTSPLAAG
jgi:hypothetical protein